MVFIHGTDDERGQPWEHPDRFRFLEEAKFETGRCLFSHSGVPDCDWEDSAHVQDWSQNARN